MKSEKIARRTATRKTDCPKKNGATSGEKNGERKDEKEACEAWQKRKKDVQ